MKIKGLFIWNIALTILLIGIFINGCSSYDPRYDDLFNEVNTNREAIRELSQDTKEALIKLGEVTEYVTTENRLAIDQIRDVVNKHSEALNENSSSLEQIITILKLAALF